MGLKTNLLKSVVYRCITIVLGLITAYIVTGDLGAALGLSIVTESVQSVNYFAFESVWNYYYEKKLRQKITEELREREVDLKFTLGMVIDISKEFSEVDTFVPEVYNSILKFYNKVIENTSLEEYHKEILESKKSFETLNKGRFEVKED